MKTQNKKIIALIGGSGSGKSTIGRLLEKSNVIQIVSHTTRAPRKGEVEGVDYYYITKEVFDTLEKIEEVEYNNNFYCFSKEEVDQKLNDHDNLYVVIDKHGYDQMAAIYGDIVQPFYIYIPLDVMRERMIARGDTKENVESRIQHAINTKELENGKYFPERNHINNIDLNESVSSILKIAGIV